MTKLLVLVDWLVIFLFSNAKKKVVAAIRIKNIAKGENSGMTIGVKFAVTVPAPLMVADVDAEEESTIEIEGEAEMLQFWKL